MIALNSLSSTDYRNLIRQMLFAAEADKSTPYFDSASPNKFVTIGRGFNIEGDIQTQKDVFNAMGLGDSSKFNGAQQTALIAKENAYIQQLENIISGPDTNNAQLQADLNAVMYARAHDPAFANYSHITSRSTFQLSTTEIESVFTSVVERKDLQVIDSKIADRILLPYSRERAVLVAMAFQGLVPSRSAAIKAALVINSSRPEAWFEIRYKGYLGASDQAGQAKRHYYEAEVFGLYEPGTTALNISDEEAKSIMRMYTVHKTEIEQYERKFGIWDNQSGTQLDKQGRLPINAANQDYSLSGDAQVDTIYEALNPARNYLIKKYVTDEASITTKPIIDGDVLVGSNGDEQSFQQVDGDAGSLKGTAKNDLMLGEGGYDKLEGGAGDDVLYGGTGNDILEGGTGNDTLIGGEGVDTYIWNAGDHDRIIDSDGQGWIRFKAANGTTTDISLAGAFLRTTPDGNQWNFTLPDGSIAVLSHNSPWKISMPDGSILELGDDFEDGDYGINLVAPSTTATQRVTGNAQGNVIVSDQIYNRDPNDSHINRSTLAASPEVYFAGDVSGSSIANIIEGGGGADIISGGAGDDKLYSDMEITDLPGYIAAASVAQGTGLKGDWLTAGLGDDLVVGGADNDILFGGGGEDLIVGGAGDDVIDGDDNFIASSFDSTANVRDNGNPWDIHWTPVSIVDYAREVGGNDVVYAGAGNDKIVGLHGDDILMGEDGDDIISGGEGSDTILGGNGADKLTGEDNQSALGDGLGSPSYGSDYIDGGAGDDLIQGEQGNDYLLGGDGDDEVWGESKYHSIDPITAGVDYLDGGNGDDKLYGGDKADQLYGGDGDDRLDGDYYDSGANAGNDYLDGGAGNDRLLGAGADDELYGGDGDDVVDGDADNIPISDQGNDKLYGGNGNDTLVGHGGNDTLDGGEGDDGLYGGEGNDTLISNSGHDYLDGGDGDDIYYINGNGFTLIDDKKGINTVYATGVSSADQLTIRYGTAANGKAGYVFGAVTDDSNVIVGGVQVLGAIDEDNANTLFQFSDGSSASFAELLGINETESQAIKVSEDASASTTLLNAGQGNDTLVGGNQAGVQDYLNGWAGNDTMYAQAGNDSLSGGSGNDVLYADEGDDTLKGGIGNDALEGGLGIDTYLLNLGDGIDTITEYSDSISHIKFGAGISVNDISISYADPDKPDPSHGFTLHYSATDSVEFKAGLIDGLAADFTFSDGSGTVASIEELLLQSVKTSQVLTGDGFNNILMGGTQHDNLSGLSGDDALISGLGDDTLLGGQGNDTLIGGAGNDNYLLNLGDGQDLIIDSNQSDNMITFGSGISLDNLTTRSVTDADGKYYLIINYGMQGDSITIENGTNNAVTMFKFTDGNVTYSLNQIPAFSYNLVGTAASETLVGGRSSDTLKGNAGADTLMGGLGDDTYTVKVGDGADTIIETDNGSLDAINRLDFGTVNINQVTGTKRIDADGKEYLVLQYGSNPSDSVSILNGFQGAIERFSLQETYTYHYDWGDYSFDTNLTLSWQDLIAKTVITALTIEGTAQPDQLTGGKADDVLNGNAGNDTLSGSAGNDTLDGGVGSDVMTGGAGIDTYLLKRSTGKDVIIEESIESNRILLDDDINVSELEVSRYGDDMVVSIASTQDSLTLKDYFKQKTPWQISSADGVNNTTVENLWNISEANKSVLPIETRIVNYKNDFLNKIKTNEEEVFNDLYQYDTNTFEASTISQTSDAANIYGTATNNSSSNTQLTGIRTYTVYSYAPAIQPQIHYRFLSLDTAYVLYGKNNQFFTLPNGALPVITSGVGQNGTELTLIGYNIPIYSGVTYGAYTLTPRTESQPIYTTFNNRSVVVEYINGGASDNQIYETSSKYAYSFDGVRLYFEDGYYGYYNDYYTTTWLDAAHQLIDAGGGNDTLNGGGWSLDSNGVEAVWGSDSTQGSSSNFFNSMGTRPGSFFYGGEGDDIIIGTALADELIGGLGNDTLNGAAGADLYRVLSGDGQGWDTIDDSGYARVLPQGFTNGFGSGSNLYSIDEQYGGPIPTDTVVFEAGISRQHLVVTWAEVGVDNKLALNISWNNGSGIHVMMTSVMPQYKEGEAQAPYYQFGGLFKGGFGIESFQFADGSSMTLDDMIALAPPSPPRQLFFKLGDGVVTVASQWKSIEWLNLIEFDSSIMSTDIKVERDGDDVLLTHRNGVDQVRITDWYSIVATKTPGLLIKLGDGNVSLGGPGNDFIYGDLGYSQSWSIGNDIILGGDGDDIIDGIGGNDFLDGGDGSDQYSFNYNYSNYVDRHLIVKDTGLSSGDVDVINLSTYSTNSVVLNRVQNDLLISLDPDGYKSLTLADWYLSNGKTIEQIQFHDALWTNQDLLALAPNQPTTVNVAPVVQTLIHDLTATEDSSFNFTIPSDAFVDDNAGDVLSYTARLQDGTALPSWLTFNTASQNFAGLPINADVGDLRVTVVATDIAGESVSQTFGLSVQNVNDAPSAIGSVANQQAIDGNHYSFTLPDGLFEDIDVGDVLSYSFTMADGSALPAWLNFDSQTKMLSGTPGASVIGNLSLKVTATDLAGVSAFITFGLAVNAMPDQSVIGTIANESLITGSGNDTLDGAAGVDTLSGGYGNDLYLVDNAADVVTEAAGQGNDTVQSSVSYTLAGNVENLTLTGTTAINATGNSLNNVLTGNSGNNTLNGLVGADTLIGALGNDLYIVDNVADMVTESVSEGTDTVQSSVTYTLSANVENLTLTGTNLTNGTGNELNNTIIGNTAANTLTGGLGNDTINGGGGVDTMIGGLGNDSYTIDWLTDVITENEDEGIDTVNVSINNANGTYALANNVENAYISSSVAYNLTGNALNNALTGNSAANALTGGDGNDTLKGGSGADTLNGGAGIDTISYSETWTGIQINLGAGTATGGDATGDVLIGIENIIGSGANDTLIGDSGNNYLDGSMGADSLSGGLGNDKYVLDNASDVVTENANEGIDTVVALNIHYTLGANVENLILQGGNGSNGTGNSLNNEITGNQLNNVLNGGAGADTMSGGLSYDTYIVDDIGDIVIENVNEGTDAVQASVTYTLSDNVENLTLTGTANLNGFGNASNNNITGNSGNNQLSGGLGNDNLDGNAGNDTMLGGLGNDIYVVDSAADVVVESGNEGIDTVRASIAYTLGANVENLTLSDSSWYGGGNGLDNVLIGGTPYNRLEGFDGNDTLDGGFGVDTMIGGAGNDTYIVDNASDVVTENSSEGNDTVRSLISYTLNTNVENLTLLGAANINGIGNALSNFLSGNSAINTLSDATGNDLLQGMAGADVLNDTSGNNLLDGGLDNDAITGGSGNDILIGGLGNDTITTGTGYDVISFNKGDGQDIVNASTGADNTISLGGSFAYSDLSLSKTGNDLLLKVGATDQITLKDWYAATANKSVINLQVIAEAVSGFSLGSSDALRNNKIENFNFANLVAAYDTAGNPASWALTDAILTAHLKTGSDSAAIGGDLAYQYGFNGNLTGIGLLAAQGVMNTATVGQSAQTLNSPTTWQAEAVKLG